MTSFICDQIIDFEAKNAYEAQDIERLIEQVKTLVAESKDSKVVILLRNAHYLTTRAFVILYNYIQEPFSTNAVFVLVSTDKSRIFPPLLDLVEHRQQLA
jgi:DNA polymerase III gamma/tau subunit